MFRSRDVRKSGTDTNTCATCFLFKTERTAEFCVACRANGGAIRHPSQTPGERIRLVNGKEIVIK